MTAGWVEGTSWSEGRADVVGIEREAIVISIDLDDTHKGIVIVDTVKVLVAFGWSHCCGLIVSVSTR